MIQKAEQKDNARILRYIGDSYEECPYLYMNLRKYGIDDPTVSVWLDEDRESDKLLGVYLKYFDCLHFFTKDLKYQVHDILSQIELHHPKVIFMQMQIGEKIGERMTPFYELHHMDVMSASRVRSAGTDGVKRADRSDIPPIVDFLMSDAAYANVYDRKTVYDQFLQRYDDGYSRFHYVSQNGKIVSCAGTNAELNDIAVIGGLLTSPPCRKQGLCSKVTSSIWKETLSEGKRVFSFVDNPVSKRLHDRLGICAVGTVAKFCKR